MPRASKAASAKFPRELFVVEEDDGDGGTFFAAHREIEGTVEIGQRQIVARYVFQDTVNVSGVAKVES